MITIKSNTYVPHQGSVEYCSRHETKHKLEQRPDAMTAQSSNSSSDTLLPFIQDKAYIKDIAIKALSHTRMET